MPFLGRPNARLLYFWLVQFGVAAVIWDFLPNALSKVLLAALIVLANLSLYRRQTNLPVLVNVALIVLLAEFWLGSGFISPLNGAALVLIGVTLTGILAQSFREGAAGRYRFPVWLFLGFVAAQFAALIAYWPIFFAQKALLATALFYLFWELIELLSGHGQPSLKAHFIFVSITVLIIIGGIMTLGG